MSLFQPPAGMQSPFYGADFGPAAMRALRKAFVFLGRASRSEYWWGILALILVEFALRIIQGIILGPAEALSAATSTDLFAGFGNLVTLPIQLLVVALNIPQISLGFRRLHDAGYTGWWAVLTLVPYAGWIAIIVIGILPTNHQSRFENLL